MEGLILQIWLDQIQWPVKCCDLDEVWKEWRTALELGYGRTGFWLMLELGLGNRT